MAALLCLLAAQFVLRMTANFYTQIPYALPGVRGNFDTRLGSAARWALLRGPPEIKLHVAVGLAIGACAITLAVLAIRSRDWRGPCSRADADRLLELLHSQFTGHVSDGMPAGLGGTYTGPKAMLRHVGGLSIVFSPPSRRRSGSSAARAARWS